MNGPTDRGSPDAREFPDDRDSPDGRDFAADWDFAAEGEESTADEDVAADKKPPPDRASHRIAGGITSSEDRFRRLAICALVIAVLVGVGIASRNSSKSVAAPVAFTVPAAAGASAIAPDDVSSTAWYCASGQPATLVLSNDSASAVSGVVTSALSSKSQPISVPGGGEVQVAPTKHESGPQAATVTLSGGGVAVSEAVHSSYGWSVTSCASRASASWYFPQGSTVAGNNLTLDLYDPSVTQAVVDIDVVTASGKVEPTDYQGIAVPAGGLVTEKLDEHATSDPEVATIVEAASGSVVAEELQQYTSGHAIGISEQLGAPAPQQVWGFPYSVEPRGGSVVFNILNPGSTASQVVLDATYGNGSSVHPVTLSVPASSTASVALNHEPGFEALTSYAVRFTASSDIVIGRSIARPKKPPVPNAGSSLGVPVGGEHWLVPAVPTPGKPWSLTFEDLGSRPVKVTVTKALGGAAPVAGSSNTFLVQPGEQLGVTRSVLNSFVEPLDVQATGPIAIELDASPAAWFGVVQVPCFVAP